MIRRPCLFYLPIRPTAPVVSRPDRFFLEPTFSTRRPTQLDAAGGLIAAGRNLNRFLLFNPPADARMPEIKPARIHVMAGDQAMPRLDVRWLHLVVALVLSRPPQELEVFEFERRRRGAVSHRTQLVAARHSGFGPGGIAVIRLLIEGNVAGSPTRLGNPGHRVTAEY